MHLMNWVFVFWALCYATAVYFFILRSHIGQLDSKAAQSTYRTYHQNELTGVSGEVGSEVSRHENPTSSPSKSPGIGEKVHSEMIRQADSVDQIARKTKDNISYDFAVVSKFGDIRIRLFAEAAPLAAAYLRNTIEVVGVPLGVRQNLTSSLTLTPLPPSPCVGCRFYRAEPVPSWWGSSARPDSSYTGGRWGPPYALLQGAFAPNGPKAVLHPPKADQGPLAHPLLTRGAIAWAGGGAGSHFFIALADHPEWSHSHTVFGAVVSEDLDDPNGALASIMRLPTKEVVQGSKSPQPVHVTNLADPTPFSMRGNFNGKPGV
mmetsp:Transcript_43106/g.87153  ORF Transcript_43106/g.87153 Transcript_43106/m.87153 type:complete len:319 (-) Transcript_43106:231-1187(-)